MEIEQARRIIGAYGDVLIENVATGVVRDINALPYSKAEIKTAILAALKVVTDETTRIHLRGGYVSLGDFQMLSGAEFQALQTWNNATSKRSSMDNIGAVAEEISRVGKIVMEVQTKSVS